MSSELLDSGAAAVISVAEFDRRLRRAVEAVSGNEWVVGEVSSLKCATSGHIYFTLKDEREDALIECVMYRGQSLRYRGLMVDGARLQIAGKATLWAPRGRLQFVVERARPEGRGALLEALERLKQKLLAEGLFEVQRKRPLPSAPRAIGVVTSATGAAFWDIVAVAARRGRAHIILAPAQVQGDGAVEQLISALDLIERHPLVDALIIGRGGGAGEDLIAFNDERLVRRIARATVPTVSAVGHDIDVTLADLVADQRAATPSQAAELLVADYATRCELLHRLHEGLTAAMQGRIADDRQTAETLRLRLRDPRFLVLVRQQQLDEYRGQLEQLMARRMRGCRPTLDRLTRRVAQRDPRLVLGQARAAISGHERALVEHIRARGLQCRARLAELNARLEGLSPLAVLGRGYAIASRLDGRVIRGPDDLSPGESFRIRLGRGEVSAVAQQKDALELNGVDAATAGIDHEGSD